MELTRRNMMVLGSGAVLATGLGGLPAFATATEDAIAAFTGGAEMTEGDVTLNAPEIAENGNTVPIGVSADGAEEIIVFADGNPNPGGLRGISTHPRLVQYMLKFVVPIYLLVIFGFFCADNLPSSNEKLFSVVPDVARPLDVGGTPPVTVSAGLEESQTAAVAAAKDDEKEAVAAKYDLPYGATVTGQETRWYIKDKKNITQFLLVLNDDVNEIDVYKHKAGAVETVISKTGSLVSILFIAGLFLFMCGMIHIAGRRWKAEGKFDNLKNAEEAA